MDKVRHCQGRPGCPVGVGVLPVCQAICLPVILVVLIRPYEVLLVLRVHLTVGIIIACTQLASLRQGIAHVARCQTYA